MSNKELLREYTDPAIYNSHHERFERLGLPHTQEEWIRRAAGMSFHSGVLFRAPKNKTFALKFLFKKKKSEIKNNIMKQS